MENVKTKHIISYCEYVPIICFTKFYVNCELLDLSLKQTTCELPPRQMCTLHKQRLSELLLISAENATGYFILLIYRIMFYILSLLWTL